MKPQTLSFFSVLVLTLLCANLVLTAYAIVYFSQVVNMTFNLKPEFTWLKVWQITYKNPYQTTLEPIRISIVSDSQVNFTVVLHSTYVSKDIKYRIDIYDSTNVNLVQTVIAWQWKTLVPEYVWTSPIYPFTKPQPNTYTMRVTIEVQ